LHQNVQSNKMSQNKLIKLKINQKLPKLLATKMMTLRSNRMLLRQEK